MDFVRAKKHLGQHFLRDENIAYQVSQSISKDSVNVLEVGPGMGVLTKHLLDNTAINLYVVEIDRESIAFLYKYYPQLNERIIEGDFLKMDVEKIFTDKYAIIGNFPYNISSQILFKAYDHHDKVDEVVGMFQKEVAERIASKPGKKSYGILSVLLQAYYDIEYLFTVESHVFDPPPKVQSAVIRLKRNATTHLNCDEILMKRVVKMAFNQRRKTLRNSLSFYTFKPEFVETGMLTKRAEQLSVEDFVIMTNAIVVSE